MIICSITWGLTANLILVINGLFFFLFSHLSGFTKGQSVTPGYTGNSWVSFERGLNPWSLWYQSCSELTGVTQDLVGQQHILSRAGSAQSGEYLCDGICTTLHSCTGTWRLSTWLLAIWWQQTGIRDSCLSLCSGEPTDQHQAAPAAFSFIGFLLKFFGEERQPWEINTLEYI